MGGVGMAFGVVPFEGVEAFFELDELVAGGEVGLFQEFVEALAQVAFGLFEFLAAVGNYALGEILGIGGGKAALFHVFVEDALDFVFGDYGGSEAGKHGFFDEVDHGGGWVIVGS